VALERDLLARYHDYKEEFLRMHANQAAEGGSQGTLTWLMRRRWPRCCPTCGGTSPFWRDWRPTPGRADQP
jgi:hypothetical protein